MVRSIAMLLAFLASFEIVVAQDEGIDSQKGAMPVAAVVAETESDLAQRVTDILAGNSTPKKAPLLFV